jgi:Type VI secretion system (T6SS), amidase effector protein 4
MPTFATLWSKHPHVTGEGALLDSSVYQNQCAINLSASLIRSGVDMRTFPGQWSWQKDKPKYAIRAQEIANWLLTPATHLHTKVEMLSASEVFSDAAGKRGIRARTGIVFFQHYWGPGANGDHIDLWNGFRLTDMFSYVRIYARLGSLGFSTDYRLAKSVWFFPIT